MNRFIRPQSDLLASWSSELVDWWGNPVCLSGNRIVHFNGKNWFVKSKQDPEECNRDRLAYLLGRSWTNVAEVRTLSESDWEELREAGILGPAWASNANTFLVRLVHDYSVQDLLNTDIDAAVASELVFSLWIRRRDTHAANRAYIGGIPVFFDHQTGLLGEPHLRNLDIFFAPGSDAGHASRWRVETARPETTPTTTEMRRLGKSQGKALHLVRDLARFEKCIQDAAQCVQNQSRGEWHRAARAAGYGESRTNAIVAFLERTRLELPVAIERMRRVINGLPEPGCIAGRITDTFGATRPEY